MIATAQFTISTVNDGVGIASSIIDYSVSSSGTTPPGNIITDGSGNPILSNDGKPLTDGSWTTTLPDVPEGQYLWTRTRFVLSNESFDMIYNVSYSGEDGATGAQGVSVTKVSTEYRLSDSSISMTGSGTGYSWSETMPKCESGQYIWKRERTDLSNGASVYSNATCDITTSEVVFDVDQNKKAISQKVWSSDITSSISAYDGSTASAMRDRITQTETDISGITSTVSDHSTRISNNETNISSVQTTANQAADHISWMIDVDGKTASTFTFKPHVMELVNADLVVKDTAGSQTIISGGKIHANAITADMLATNAIKSTNYNSGVSGSDIPSGRYSTTGTFLNLTNGNIYTPNFSVNAVNGEAYLNGTIYANAGQIGDPGNAYWNIGTVTDSTWGSYAGLIANGNALIQSGKLTLSSDLLNSQNSGNYIKSGNYWYDFGLQVPDFDATGTIGGQTYKENFLYIRRISTQPTSGTLDSAWTYLFRVDKSGNIYWNGHNISDGIYLPLSGGTVDGDLTVTGTLTATASAATKLASGKTIQTNLASTSSASFDGTANITPGVTGTLGVGNGGTGKSSWTANGILYASASNALAQMAVGTSGQVLTSKGNAAPAWTNQSALSVGSATKATQDSDGNAINTTYRKLTNNTFDSIDVTDLSTGNLTVTGAATFTNGLSGDLTGNATTATTATQVSNNLKIQLNGGTTEGTNQFTYDGSAAKNINITKSSVGLGNVENTALSTWAGSANLTTAKVGTLAAAAVKGVDTSISAASTSTNLPTSAAVASFVEGKGYVTSSGVTSITLTAGDGISLNASTAITSTGTRTITNAGVRAISESSSNGKITVNTNGTSADVAVHGLGSWAYKSSGSGSDVGLENVINVKQVTGIGQGDNGKIRVWKGTGANDYEDIEVTITAYDQSVVSKADALDMNTDAGSTTLPVYFPGSGSDAGKPVAITSIPWSLISNAPSTYAPSSHTHGNISNDGKISATATISSGDRLAIIDTDTTAGNKLTGSSITFGSSTTTFLSNSGAWLTPTNTTYTFADGSAGNFTVTPSGGSAQTVSIGTPAKAGALNLSTAIGSATQPVYFGSDGVPVAANKIPKLNNASSDSAFYAPTTVGTSGQVLTSSGSGAPSWVNQSTLSVGAATTASQVSGTAGVTNANRHVWFSDSATETIRNYDDDFKYNPNTNTLTVANLAGNAATATKATQDGSGNTITSTYVTLATAQTISGAKTLSAATSFTNTTASTSKTTGAVKVSGGVGVAGRVSANEVSIGDSVVLQFNTSTNSLDFVFN